MKYVHADAKIIAPDKVEVWAEGMKSPKYVRFGWNALARFNLVNSADSAGGLVSDGAAGGQVSRCFRCEPVFSLDPDHDEDDFP